MKPIITTLYTILFFCLLHIFTACKGQNPHQNSIAAIGDTVAQTADSILVIFQAKDNSYWFGSNGRGIYRYDGKYLIQYTTQHGLSNNRIWGIAQDNAGNIYVTTAIGVDKYDGKTITNLKPVASTNPTNWQLQPGDLWFKNGMEDSSPYRYDGTKLYRLAFPKNPREDEWNTMYPYTTLSPYGIYTTYTDSKGRIWFGTGALGVGCYNGSTFKWIAEDDLTEIHNGPSNGVRSIIEDKNGDFWLGNTFYRYTITTTPLGEINYKRQKGLTINDETVKEKGFEYMSAAIDTAGNMWIATFSNGVWRYDGKTVAHYPVLNGNGDVTLFSVYVDKQGNLWLGTHTDGVYKWNGNTFEKFRFN